MAEDLEIGDSRIEFMALYVLKTLKLKNDKWTKLYALDENKVIIQEFLEKSDNNLLVFTMNAAQLLAMSYSYPSSIKTKSCYFAKKTKDPIGKDVNIKDALLYGDLSYSPLEQLSAILDEVKIKIKFKKKI
jgi:dynein heavy chain